MGGVGAVAVVVRTREIGMAEGERQGASEPKKLLLLVVGLGLPGLVGGRRSWLAFLLHLRGAKHCTPYVYSLEISIADDLYDVKTLQ